MHVNAELASLLSSSGGELRKMGSKWLVTNGSKACIGDTPDAAAEAFLAARLPRQRDVIDRLTVIDTVVREPATPVDDARIKALEDSLSQTDAALRFLLEPAAVEPVQYAAFPDPMPAELEKILRNSQHNFPENLTDRLSDWDTDEASLTTADLTEEVIQKLTAAKRKKFTELLNVELAELQQERGGPREDLSREAEIEKLLGLFARVGEM